MNLLSILLKTLLSDGALSVLGKKTGLNAKQLKKLIPLAIPVLIKFLTKNASSQSGALSLLGALTQHTSQKTMVEQLDEADEEDGGKIIGHILGNESAGTIASLAGQSGLSETEVQKALGGMAPALLSSLSAATNTASAGKAAGKVDLSDGLDLSEVMTLLGGKSQSSGLGGLLGGLFGGKQEQDSKANGMELLSLLSALK